MGGHITHCTVATTQRDALVAVGRCVGHVGWAWRGRSNGVIWPSREANREKSSEWVMHGRSLLAGWLWFCCSQDLAEFRNQQIEWIFSLGGNLNCCCWNFILWTLLTPNWQFQHPRNQPISQRAENSPRRAHRWQKALRGWCRPSWGMRPPGLRIPSSARHRRRSAAVPALRFALYHTALPSHSFALCHNCVCRASFSLVVPLHCAPCG